MVSILGLVKAGRHSLLADATHTGDYKCSFPGCSRVLGDDGSLKVIQSCAQITIIIILQLHARTHLDGDWTALKTGDPEKAVKRSSKVFNDHAARTPGAHSAVVFVGAMEHHSNLLPWRESSALVIEIKGQCNGLVDQADLAEQLHRYSHIPLRIGTFSAASNVTGTIEEVDAITALLHQSGALAFWDYAAGGTHMRIDMNPARAGVDAALLAKDAVFLSPHKFPGGPGSPGVLVVKKRLLTNDVPSTPGGGTVFFVTSDRHRYLENFEEREEGGTQNILGIVRCGLAFQLKVTVMHLDGCVSCHLQASVGDAYIERRDHELVQRLLTAWGQNPHIRILGCTDKARVPVWAAGMQCMH